MFCSRVEYASLPRGRKPQSLIDETRELDLLSVYLSKFNVSGIVSALFPSEWQPH